jgi:hypothetical protein
MINKRDELRAAVTSSRSRSVRVARTQTDTNSNDHTIPAPRLSPRARVQAIASAPLAPSQIVFTLCITLATQ